MLINKFPLQNLIKIFNVFFLFSDEFWFLGIREGPGPIFYTVRTQNFFLKLLSPFDKKYLCTVKEKNNDKNDFNSELISSHRANIYIIK